MTHFSMNTSEDKSKQILPQHDLWYWLIAFHISLLSIVGNITVIYIISTTSKLQTKQNAFILSLAMADLSVGLFIAPSSFVCSQIAMCELELQVVFYNFLLFASMANLMVLTFDRYIAVIYPMKYTSIITKTNTCILISIAWVFAFFSSFIQLAWFYSDYEVFMLRADRVYRLVADLLLGLLPCVAFLFAFLRIFIAIRGQLSRQESQLMQVAYNHHTASLSVNIETTPRLERTSTDYNSARSAVENTQRKNKNSFLKTYQQDRRSTDCNSARSSVENINTQRKTKNNKHRHHSSVRVLGGVVLLFIFCYSFNIVISFCDDYDLCETTQVFRDISQLFIFVNSSVNFIVYALLKKEFRQTLNLRIRSLRN